MKAAERGHTTLFLAGLVGTSKDSSRASVTIQTFTDGTPKPFPDPLARTLHGCLDDLAPGLDTMNAQGAGVFIAVNATDGRGRKKANIRALRGWHVDLDLKDAAEPFTLENLPLPPSIAVRTPGGWHLYWLADSPMPCGDEARRGEHEAELKALAHTLARWGADPAVCQVAAVLRLPGYFHRKAEPRLVELVTAGGPRYSREAFRAAFPAVSAPPAPLAMPTRRPVPYANRAAVLRRAEAYLSALPGGIQGQNGSGATFAAALKVCTRFDLTESELLELLEGVHNPRCVPVWSASELAHKAADAWRAAQAAPDLGCALRATERRRVS